MNKHKSESSVLFERVGENLRIFRGIRNLTKSEIAEKIGIGSRMYSYWESGQKSMTVEQLCEIASILDFPISLFFIDKNEIVKYIKKIDDALTHSMQEKELVV